MAANRLELLEFARSVEKLTETATSLDLTLPAYLLKVVRMQLAIDLNEIAEEELTVMSRFFREQSRPNLH